LKLLKILRKSYCRECLGQKPASSIAEVEATSRSSDPFVGQELTAADQASQSGIRDLPPAAALQKPQKSAPDSPWGVFCFDSLPLFASLMHLIDASSCIKR
jgi:hypothetical protein